LGDLEPFFGSLALFNMKTKQKLSENFYFDLNAENTLKLIGKDKKVRNTTKFKVP
jgi:hypothetical protein